MPSSTRQPKRFRPCVAAILQNRDGMILICERVDFSNSWQFPQGGIDPGESPRQALARELVEEISLEPQHYQITKEAPGYRYYFPARQLKRGRYAGQEQTYFLCRFDGPDALLNLATAHPEFRSFRWILPHEFDLRWLPDFKRPVYRKVLTDFFGVEEFLA